MAALPVSRIRSINLAEPRTLPWRGRQVKTGIYKVPTTGPIGVSTLGLVGDMQADLRVHGGPRKAVYVYPHEHYDFWRGELSIDALPPGSFGENLTTTGLLETEIHPGDRLHAGGVIFEVTGPRTPCFKLALKFGRGDMIERFLAALRPGFYLAVVQEGVIEAGMTIDLFPARDRSPSITQAAEAKWRS